MSNITLSALTSQFFITDYGAVSDGTTDNSGVIMDALGEADDAGGRRGCRPSRQLRREQ
jgi:polygalacturonase